MAETHQSKFGFHPCDMETYEKLRTLKRLYWLACTQNAMYIRWARKDPKNRFVFTARTKVESPVRTDVAVPEPVRFIKVWNRRLRGEQNRLLAQLDSHGVLEDFANARYPQKEAKDVKPLKLSLAKIDETLKLALEYEKLIA